MIPNPISVTTPHISLLKQTSLCEELVGKNGNQKIIHTVVKNSPFCVTFGFSSSSNSGYNEALDLHKYTIDISLYYDADCEKEVDFIKSKPVIVKSSINPNGTKLTSEVRIKVLTSQLEDMLFRVGLKATDPSTKKVLFTCHSEAIKVISKSDQVKNKKAPRKKRNVADVLVDYLSDIESKQEEHAKLLARICDANEQILLDTKTISFITGALRFRDLHLTFCVGLI